MIKTILGLLGVDDASGPFTSNLKFTGGGTSSSNVNTLDAYVEGTFVPSITFGGGSTGLTYSSRGGTYTRIGNMVFCTAFVILSAKGSSTGDMVLTGLPYAATATLNSPGSVTMDGVTSGVGDSFMSARVAASTNNVFLFKHAAGIQARLTEADFTDTTTIGVSVAYRV